MLLVRYGIHGIGERRNCKKLETAGHKISTSFNDSYR